MKETLAGHTVGEIVAANPRRSVVFERFGIDYCCGGKRPLASACEEKQLEVSVVESEIASVDRQGGEPAVNWQDSSLTELADHIVATHHAYLRENLPRLLALSDKVNAAHGTRDPRYAQLRLHVHAVAEELQSHLLKEERILFPLIRTLDTATEAFRSHCGTVANPIGVMEAEHDGAGGHLGAMRRLTDDFTPAADACNTTRALIAALADLEADLHAHIHKENNVLFPRAIAKERELDAPGSR